MAVKSTANLKIFINANVTANGVNSNTGANMNTILIDIVDSFFSVVSVPAVTGSGIANRMTRWASTQIAESGTWTNAGNTLIPVTNNSALGSLTLGVQSFHAAATSTTASLNIKTSAGTDPSSPVEGMLWYNGTNLYFRDSSTSVDILASATLTGSGTTNTLPMFTASGVIGDSPVKHDGSGNINIETGNLSVGIAIASAPLHVQDSTSNITFISENLKTSGDAYAMGAQTSGSNGSGKNVGVYGITDNGGINVGIAGIGGILDPDHWATMTTAHALNDVGGAFSVRATTAEKSSAIIGYNPADTSSDAYGIDLLVSNTGTGTPYGMRVQDGTEGIGKVLTCITADGKAQWADPNPVIIGGLVVTSTSTTDVSNGSYNILEDTTALTSVSSGIAQDSDWTLEITEAGITNQKGRVSAVIKCEKTGGAGRQYDFAIFKNGSIISDSEMTDLTLENNDTWSNIKCTAPVELSTGDLFSIRVSGNGTGDDIECTNGTIYIN